MLEKTYDPASTEQRLYEAWESSGAFSCGQRPNAESYCIVIPPPNVTGSLHMGHALLYAQRNTIPCVELMVKLMEMPVKRSAPE